MDPDEIRFREEAIAALVALAPRGWKLLFLNYELEDHPSTTVADAIFFAVVKPLLKPTSKVNLRVDIQARQPLNKLGRHIMSKSKQPFLTLDFLIRSGGHFKMHVDYSQPERIGGSLTSVRRHERYVKEEPLLASI